SVRKGDTIPIPEANSTMIHIQSSSYKSTGTSNQFLRLKIAVDNPDKHVTK
ncbi:unnamed protein product, partial [Rotaria magnacalcarata]